MRARGYWICNNFVLSVFAAVPIPIGLNTIRRIPIYGGVFATGYFGKDITEADTFISAADLA